MINLQGLLSKFVGFPTKENEYEIENKKYKVISHFVGEKDINEILINLAKKQAYDQKI